MQNITPLQKQLIIFVVVGGNFLFLFNQFLLITAFPTLMEEFNINAAQVQWLTTAFLLTSAVFIPMSGYLIDRFTTRGLVLTSFLFLAAGTLLALLSESFAVLILSRVIQAVGAGIMLPLVQTVLLLIFPVKQRGKAMGLLGLVMNVAPATGPAVSGYIIDMYTWKHLFWIILPPTFLLLLLALFYLKNITEQRETRFDILSVLLSTFGLTGLLIGSSYISTAGLLHWSVWGPVAAGMVSLYIFGRRQLWLKAPILNVRVFRYPIYALTTGSVFFVGILLLSTETILPLFAQDVQGSSAFVSGFILMPGTAVLAFMSLAGGMAYDKYGGKWLINTGFVLLISSIILFIFMQPDTSIIFITAIFCLFMAGIGMTMMPQVAAGMNDLPREELAHGTALSSTIRQFGMALGVTLLSTVVSAGGGPDMNYQESLYAGVRQAFIVMAVLAAVSFSLYLWIFRMEKT